MKFGVSYALILTVCQPSSGFRPRVGTARGVDRVADHQLALRLVRIHDRELLILDAWRLVIDHEHVLRMLARHVARPVRREPVCVVVRVWVAVRREDLQLRQVALGPRPHGLWQAAVQGADLLPQ